MKKKYPNPLRDFATENNYMTYESLTPCKHGHRFRYVKSNICVTCSTNYYKNNREKRDEQMRQYFKENKRKIYDKMAINRKQPHRQLMARLNSAIQWIRGKSIITEADQLRLTKLIEEKESTKLKYRNAKRSHLNKEDK